MAIGRYILTASVTVDAGTVSGDTLNDNGTTGTPADTWGPLWATTFPKGQPIALDPDGELYAAIGAGNLQLLTATQETGGQIGVSN